MPCHRTKSWAAANCPRFLLQVWSNKYIANIMNKQVLTTTAAQVLARRAHIEALNQCAEKHSEDGKFVLASFGQDPQTGLILRPIIKHFKIGQVDEMAAVVSDLSGIMHRNVYMPWVLFNPEIAPNSKGKIEDILAVLGLVADFDDDQAHRWRERTPLPPSYVLETSPGRFQVGFIFDRPLEPEEAQKYARSLKEYCRCDHGTADISHVWRLPGTLNWPNKKKVDACRSTEPWEVRAI